MMRHQKISKSTRFKGLPISPGVAVAKVCLFHQNRHNSLPYYKVSDEQMEQETTRFMEAVRVAGRQVDKLADDVKMKVGPAEAGIFNAQKMILEDPEVRKRVISEIEVRRMNAETAVTSALEFYQSKIVEIDHAYTRERIADIQEVRRRLLDVLVNLNPSFKCQGQEYCRHGYGRVIVAEELTPSLTMELDAQHVVGFVTARGGLTSHAAILARSLGIPAVSGIKNIHQLLFCGTELFVNGRSGEVVAWPDEVMLSKYPKLNREALRHVETVAPIARLEVMANLNLAKDIQEALDHKAEGIGLYRTEFEFLAAGKLLDEDEQYERYVNVLKAMKGRKVYYRLLDIGGDKKAPFFDLPRERNPYLGFRGGRFLLGRRDLLRTQARALARASKYGAVHVMYPMVVELSQFVKLKKIFTKETADISPQNIRHGVMFEVPAACLQAEELLKAADFASIGSNDLIQYLFSVDRNNDLVAYDYSPDRKIFWTLIRRLAETAAKADRPLSVCGEMASEPKYVTKLLEAGVRSVSVSPKLIPGLRLSMRDGESSR